MENLIKMKVPGDPRTFSRTAGGETYVWRDERWLRVYDVAPEIERLLDERMLPRLERIALEQRRANEKIIKYEEKHLREYLAKAREVSKFHGGVWMEIDSSQSVDKVGQLFRVAPFWEIWIESTKRSYSKHENSKPSTVFMLPTDCLLLILDHLDIVAITCLGLTCKGFHTLISQVHDTKIPLRTKGVAGANTETQKALWVLLQSWMPSGMIWSPADNMFIRKDFYKGGFTARKWIPIEKISQELEKSRQSEETRKAEWAKWKADRGLE